VVAFRNSLKACRHSRPSIVVCEGLRTWWGTRTGMAATFRIACDNALFTMPELKLGLHDKSRDCCRNTTPSCGCWARQCLRLSLLAMKSRDRSKPRWVGSDRVTHQ